MDDVVKELVDMLSDHVCCVFPQTSLLTILLVAFIFQSRIKLFKSSTSILHHGKKQTLWENSFAKNTHWKTNEIPAGILPHQKRAQGPSLWPFQLWHQWEEMFWHLSFQMRRCKNWKFEKVKNMKWKKDTMTPILVSVETKLNMYTVWVYMIVRIR